MVFSFLGWKSVTCDAMYHFSVRIAWFCMNRVDVGKMTASWSAKVAVFVAVFLVTVSD